MYKWYISTPLGSFGLAGDSATVVLLGVTYLRLPISPPMTASLFMLIIAIAIIAGTRFYSRKHGSRKQDTA